MTREDSTFELTNTFVPEKVAFNVEKVWKGAMETSATVSLRLHGQTIITKV